MLQILRRATGLPAALGMYGDAYEAALAHSERVRKMKVLLPVAAGLISAAFIAVAVVRAYLPDDVSIASSTIENGMIVMERPAIGGRNGDGISYSMTATRALQDIANPNMITLENVKAAVPMREDVIARVTAAGGIFDRGTDKLQMTHPFDVDLSNGVTAHFQSAFLDIHSGTMETSDRVSISSDKSSIVAQSLKITDKGRNITFTGQVLVNVDPVAIRNKDN